MPRFCREAAEKYASEKGFNPSLAIALDTKGPEIRTGLLEGDDGRKEIVWEAGDIVKLTTDEAFKEKCTKEVVYVDYKNITKVMVPGKRIFIDDGLISIKANEIGKIKIEPFFGQISTVKPRFKRKVRQLVPGPLFGLSRLSANNFWWQGFLRDRTRCSRAFRAGFFLTSAVGKTKTQAQNSRKNSSSGRHFPQK